MAKRDSRNRTAWHTIFQPGVSPELFRSYLPHLLRSKDDMMTLDSDGLTPLDYLRSYWTLNKETIAIDYLNLLHNSGRLPVYFAFNQTTPLDSIAPARLPVSAELSADVSRLT